MAMNLSPAIRKASLPGTTLSKRPYTDLALSSAEPPEENSPAPAFTPPFTLPRLGRDEPESSELMGEVPSVTPPLSAMEEDARGAAMDERPAAVDPSALLHTDEEEQARGEGGSNGEEASQEESQPQDQDAEGDETEEEAIAKQVQHIIETHETGAKNLVDQFVEDVTTLMTSEAQAELREQAAPVLERIHHKLEELAKIIKFNRDAHKLISSTFMSVECANHVGNVTAAGEGVEESEEQGSGAL